MSSDAEEIMRLRDFRHACEKSLEALEWRLKRLELAGGLRASGVRLVADVVVAACAIVALIVSTH